MVSTLWHCSWKLHLCLGCLYSIWAQFCLVPITNLHIVSPKMIQICTLLFVTTPCWPYTSSQWSKGLILPFSPLPLSVIFTKDRTFWTIRAPLPPASLLILDLISAPVKGLALAAKTPRLRTSYLNHSENNSYICLALALVCLLNEFQRRKPAAGFCTSRYKIPGPHQCDCLLLCA